MVYHRLPHRLRAVLSLTTTIYTLSLLASSSTIRAALANVFSPRTHPYRLAAVIAAVLLNTKTIPLAWHVRIFGTMIYQLYIQPSPIPDRAIFRPIIMQGCFTSLLECDYNLHKSNSTYFADLDVARSALICALLRNGIRQRGTKFPRSGATSGDGVKPTTIVQSTESTTTDVPTNTTPESQPPSPLQQQQQQQQQEKPPPPAAIPKSDTPTLDAISKSKAPFTIALGAVATVFKREIKPYEPFDIWTRVLAWDRKWIYLVSHVVRAGAVPPPDIAGWGMQPWKDGGGAGWLGRLFGPARRRRGGGAGAVNGAPAETAAADAAQRREKWQKAIFASSVAKYVVKKGRITVPMDEVLLNNQLIPPRPEGLLDGDGAGSGGAEDGGDPTAWTYENVERERQRGMRLAEQFGGLDGLVDEFPDIPSSLYNGGKGGEGVVALGEYPDLIW